MGKVQFSKGHSGARSQLQGALDLVFSHPAVRGVHELKVRKRRVARQPLTNRIVKLSPRQMIQIHTIELYSSRMLVKGRRRTHLGCRCFKS